MPPAVQLLPYPVVEVAHLRHVTHGLRERAAGQGEVERRAVAKCPTFCHGRGLRVAAIPDPVERFHWGSLQLSITRQFVHDCTLITRFPLMTSLSLSCRP